MEFFPENINLKFSWRKYQKELLDELHIHLKNNHFHIIAPPGSGKTILGLEVMRRVGKPTLIFAPTISIKNQWIERFCELFLKTNEVPEWISTDLRNPGFLTITTYQALHAATKTDGDFNDILKKIKRQQVNCLLFDEAHHLKKEWYKSLQKLKGNLNCKVIALTATPPYDVDYAEWRNYIDLNGPIDAEIFVPDLLLEKNLCPHQDFVHYSFPSVEEYEAIEKQKEKSDSIFNEISNDSAIITELQKLPFFIDPEKNEAAIFENIGFYSSVLIFLKNHHFKISNQHLEIIGNESVNIPAFNQEWAEILLNYILFEDQKYFNHLIEFKEQLLQKLIRNGVIDDDKVKFSRNESVNTKLINSISKLNSIKEIVDFEHKKLQEKLRLVILTDYIRNEYLSNSVTNEIELKRIGVLSIFEKLRRENSARKKIAVLTGSVVILPKECKGFFLEKAKLRKTENLEFIDVSFDANYFQFHQNTFLNNQIVAIVTEIFTEGKIEIIIGTKSLLGEGWDAPCINSLILASFVGSFVLSNQMRGRAIRTENANPEKTANIWHLVCLNPIDENFGEDFLVMKGRFKSFVGIDYSQFPIIQNSFDRVRFKMNFFSFNDIWKINNETFRVASERQNLQKRWDFAIASGTHMVEEIKIPFSENTSFIRTKKFYYNKTVKNVLLTLFSGVLGFGGQAISSFLNNLRNITTLRELGFLLSTFGLVGVFVFGGYSFKAVKLWWRYQNISKDFLNIGTSLLKSLQFEGAIKNDKKILVETESDENGLVICNLKNATTQENSVFLHALQELVSPIDKPRYVLFRQDRFLFFLFKKDYHAVPEILGRNKKNAAFFLKDWNNRVGNAQLFFTQNTAGRKTLIKARFSSYASNFQNKSEIVNEWK